jgi:hypothetical protein
MLRLRALRRRLKPRGLLRWLLLLLQPLLPQQQVLLLLLLRWLLLLLQPLLPQQQVLLLLLLLLPALRASSPRRLHFSFPVSTRRVLLVTLRSPTNPLDDSRACDGHG